MPSNVSDTIKAISALSWDNLFKLMVFCGIFGFGYLEYTEDSDQEAEQQQESQQDILQRDLLVKLISETAQGNIREGRQEAEIDAMQKDISALEDN